MTNRADLIKHITDNAPGLDLWWISGAVAFVSQIESHHLYLNWERIGPSLCRKALVVSEHYTSEHFAGNLQGFLDGIADAISIVDIDISEWFRSADRQALLNEGRRWLKFYSQMDDAVRRIDSVADRRSGKNTLRTASKEIDDVLTALDKAELDIQTARTSVEGSPFFMRGDG